MDAFEIVISTQFLAAIFNLKVSNYGKYMVNNLDFVKINEQKLTESRINNLITQNFHFI